MRGVPKLDFFLSLAKFENFGSNSKFTIYFSADRKCGKRSGSTCHVLVSTTSIKRRFDDVGSESEGHLFFFQAFNGTFCFEKMGRTFVTDRTRSLTRPPLPRLHKPDARGPFVLFVRHTVTT